MNIEKLIRFGFASRRRKLMTLCIAGAAAMSSFLGLGGDKTSVPSSARATTTTSIVQGGAVAAVSYANCGEVRAAGKAPIRKSDPGYSAKLDRDGDGVACR